MMAKNSGSSVKFKVDTAEKSSRSKSGLTGHDERYLNSVIRPFDSQPERGPASFMSGTSLVSQVYETDLNFKAGYGYGVAALFPHNLFE